MVISIHLPDDLDRQSETFTTLLPSFRKYKLQMEKESVWGMRGKWGCIISLWVQQGEHLYSEHHLAFTEDIELRFSTTVDMIGLLIMNTGSARVKYQAGPYYFHQGNATLVHMHPTNSYTVQFHKDQPYQITFILPAFELLAGFKDRHPLIADIVLPSPTQPYASFVSTRYSKSMRAEIRKLKMSNHSEILQDLYFTNRISDILIFYLDKVKLQNNKRHEEVIIFLVTEYIDNNLHEDINTDLLAGIAGISVRTLQKILKEMHDKSVQRYVTDRRIMAAKALLLNTRKNIVEIGVELGYSDPAQFSKVFKMHVGEAPALFRSNNNVV